MNITKIKVGYSTSIPIMAYGIKDNAWAEVEVEGDADFKEVWSELKEKVDAAVREKYPHLYTTDGKPVTYEQEPGVSVIPKTNHDSMKSTLERTIEQIGQCSDIKVLETFKLLAKQNPELQQAYDNKLKTFQ